MTRILGYLDHLSVAPGESLKVMVSCEGLTHYSADLVRVIHGDVNPAGPGFREAPMRFDLGGPFVARYQPIHTGSYALISDTPQFKALTSIGIQALVWPTLPGKKPQTILSREESASGAGFRLFLDLEGALVFELSQKVSPKDKSSVSASTETPLIAQRWYLVSAGYDAATGGLTVAQRPLKSHPVVHDEASGTAFADPNVSQSAIAAPVLLAARAASDHPAREHFNGRIESPRLCTHSLDEEHKSVLMAPNHENILAAWDFSVDIPTNQITDVSANQLYGELVNLPTRGVAGAQWNGDEYCWTKRPEHYGAIHFHDDDLYDCGWDTDFELNIPDDLPSAVYAVHLHADVGEKRESYYLPFAVRPPRGKTTAPVAFLLPTASYTAYANNRIGIDVPETEIVADRLIQLNPIDLFMQEHPELGLSFYDLHNDGSGVFYSSRLRPIVNMQPKTIGHLGGVGSNVWQFNADTHILDWLEHLNQPFDVITDEDLENDGIAAIADYRVVITGTHPEYYSVGMLDGMQNYVDDGGRLMYLGGNGFYWRVSYHPRLPGVIECRKSEDGIRAFAPLPGEFYASFTGEYTGLWRRNGRAPNALVGVGMVSQGFDISSPYIRTKASNNSRAAFVFDGVDSDIIGDFGLSGGGAAGLELDAVDASLGTPPHTLILASSERHSDLYLMTPEDMNDPAPGLGGTEAEIIRADMVFFETGKGGAVFSTGSIAWCGSLSHADYNNNVASITANVLNRFLDENLF